MYENCICLEDIGKDICGSIIMKMTHWIFLTLLRALEVCIDLRNVNHICYLFVIIIIIITPGTALGTISKLVDESIESVDACRF